MPASEDDIANTLGTALPSILASLNYTGHLQPSSDPAPPEGETLGYKQGSYWNGPNHLYPA